MNQDWTELMQTKTESINWKTDIFKPLHIKDWLQPTFATKSIFSGCVIYIKNKIAFQLLKLCERYSFHFLKSFVAGKQQNIAYSDGAPFFAAT